MRKNHDEDPNEQVESSLERVIEVADRKIHDLILRHHLSHWHPISTAPCNQNLELRVDDGNAVNTLPFPCLRANNDEWIDVDLGVRIQIQPVSWRVWQHSVSPRVAKIRTNT
jgi:hypothetical protein